MYPTLTITPDFAVSNYALFWGLGYVLSLFWALRLNRRDQAFSASQLQWVFLSSLVVGVLGARITYFLVNAGEASVSPFLIFTFQSGGLVFLGGFLLAFISNILLFSFWKKPIDPCLDLLSIPLAFAHAFGRIGCFMVGCCYGSICELPWAIDRHGISVHPTQLYESAGLFIISFWLAKSFERTPRAGLIWPQYLILYGSLRFVVENFRGDAIRGANILGPLSFSQIISALLFLFGFGFFIRRFRSDH